MREPTRRRGRGANQAQGLLPTGLGRDVGKGLVGKGLDLVRGGPYPLRLRQYR